MDESPLDPSSALCIQSLLTELEEIVVLESHLNGNAWVHVSKLTDYCCQKYGKSLEDLEQLQSKPSGIKGLLRQSGRFALYSTSVPREFYVALLSEVVLVEQSLPRSKPHGGLRKRHQTFHSAPAPNFKTTPHHPQMCSWPSTITSATDLQQALTAIAIHLTNNQKVVTVAAISKTFGRIYGQPIRAVLQNVCPDLKLVEVLQSIPEIHVRKIDNDWQVTVDFRNL